MPFLQFSKVSKISFFFLNMVKILKYYISVLTIKENIKNTLQYKIVYGTNGTKTTCAKTEYIIRI